MSTTAIVPTPSATSTTPTVGNGLPAGQSLNNMFLQLLVAQLKNQDPTSPIDPSQFVGQLAQFSELSEVTSIYQLLQQVVPAPGSTAPGSGGSAAASGSTAGSATGAGANSLFSHLANLDGGTGMPAGSISPNIPNFNPSVLSTVKGNIQGAF